MRTPDGSVAEMRFLSRLLPRRAARRSPDEAIAERLLAGQDAGPGASPAQHALELALLSAARPGTERELRGETAAVAAFVQAVSTSSTRDRPTMTLSPRRAPVMAAGIMTAVVVALCGTAVAGALPAPLQRIAHTTFGAPAPALPSGSRGPGRPAPASGVPPAATGGTHVHSASASHPAVSPDSTTKTRGKSASAPGQVKKTATSTATATSGPSATSTGNGNGNGKGHNKSSGNGHGKNG